MWWPVIVLAACPLALTIVPAVLIYRDIKRREQATDPAGDAPMWAAFWWIACWPVGIYFWMRCRRPSAGEP